MTQNTGRPVGSAGLRLPRIGLGTATFGWLYTDVSTKQAVETVSAALAAGIGYIDTAPSYGLGRAESKLGAALRDRPALPVLSTKVGRLLRPSPDGSSDPAFPGAPALVGVVDWSADGVRRSLDESLTRLGLDHVDIVYMHDPDDTEGEIYATAYPALARLRDEGVVRAIGVGMNQTQMPTRFVTSLDLDVVLLAGRYTLLDHSALDELFPACLDNDVSVVAAGVFNSGVLADHQHNPTYSYSPASQAILERAARLADVCADHGTTLATAALHFSLSHPAVVTALLGMRSPAEVQANMHSFDNPPPAAFWEDLRSRRLIPHGAPTPDGQPR